jgi:CBS domain-containing protein
MLVVEDNTVIGLVSGSDILQLSIQGKNLKSPLSQEFMTRNVITAEQDSSVPSVMKALIDNQINRLPIIHQGKLVGIVTRHDLLKCIFDTTPEFTLIS